MKRVTLSLLLFVVLFNSEAQVCPTISVNTTSIACNGSSTGSATVTVTGGTLPFSYTWSPAGGSAATASGLGAGNYTVYVADASTCAIVSQTLAIDQPNPFVSVSTQTNIQCYGGTGVVSYTSIGGTPPYTYTWLPYGGSGSDATGLGPGTFTTLVQDANSCNLSQTVTLTEPPPLTSTASQTNNTCGVTTGGASVAVSGGVMPYSYTWSPSGGNSAFAALTSSGPYTISVQDANNCETSNIINFLQSTQPTLTANSTSLTCNGSGNGSATVTISGGLAPYSYTWSPSGGSTAIASGLTAGIYSINVSDAANCLRTITVAVNQPAFLTYTSVQTPVLCNGGTGTASLTVGGGITPYTYTWSPTGGNGPTAALTAGMYTVTIQDANSCTVMETYNFVQPPALTATSAQTNIICGGAATGAASISVGGGITPYTYTWSPSGGNAALATGLIAGTYTVIARDNNSCTASSSYTITEPPMLAASVAAASIICNGQSTGTATLTVSGGVPSYSYTWSPSGGNTLSATGLPGGTYSVLVTDANSCAKTFTVLIDEPAVLSSTLASNDITCYNLNDGTASLSVTGGIVPYTYTWTPGGANTSSVSALTAGNYSVTIEDANHCSDSHTFTIINPAQYTVSALASSVQCNGQSSGAATVTVLGGTPAYAYTWSPAAGSASAATGLAAGDYTVNILDANNCAASQTLTISGPSALTGSASSSAANCNNADGSATVSAGGGTGIYTYSWMPSGGTGSIASNIAAGQYTCIVKDLNNCQLNIVVVVSAITPSVFLSSGNGTICPGTSTTLTATGSDSYTWSPSASLSSANGSLVTASPSITTSYTVTGANLYGCTVTDTITVQAYPAPAPTFSISSSNLCTGTTATLNASGAVNYTWSPAAGLSDAFVSDPTLTLAGATVYTVTVIDANGCTGNGTFAVTPLLLPVVTISAPAQAICLNESATLTAGGASTYSWSSGTATGSIQVSPVTTTTYVVTGTGTNGCVSTESVSVTVNPLPDVSINSNTYVCEGATATLTASGAVSYSWNTGASGASLMDSPAADTSYTVTGTDANGCKSTANFDLVVYITPSLSISGKRELCVNEKVTLTASGATTYSWSTGDQTQAVSYAFTSNTVITVSSGVAGCAPGMSSYSITVNALPSLNVTPTLVAINAGQSVQIAASSDGTQYTWAPADGLSCTGCLNPAAQPTVTTTYTIEASNKKACKVSATVLIQVDNSCGELFTPSAFSPNEDGNNDTWCVYGNCIETLQCDIFNRWGQKIFTITEKGQCWDGKLNGVMQNPGVFIFQVQTTLTNGESKSLKGNFTLIR